MDPLNPEQIGFLRRLYEEQRAIGPYGSLSQETLREAMEFRAGRLLALIQNKTQQGQIVTQEPQQPESPSYQAA